MISYEDIDEAVLIHALYHGTKPTPTTMGWNKDDLTIDQVRADLADDAIHREFAELVRLDYYRGRPLKLTLMRKDKTFDPHWYDRDAGQGAAERIVARLRKALS